MSGRADCISEKLKVNFFSENRTAVSPELASATCKNHPCRRDSLTACSLHSANPNELYRGACRGCVPRGPVCKQADLASEHLKFSSLRKIGFQPFQN